MFDSATARKRLAEAFAVASIDAFGSFSRVESVAAAAILAYNERTQIRARPSLTPPKREAAGATMQIDAATRANLELTATLSGDRRGSLLAAIDRTTTGAGSRLLAERLTSPVTDPKTIRERFEVIAFVLERSRLRQRLREKLAAAPDIARALSRLSLDRGGPRDLAAIRDGLRAASELAAALASEDSPRPRELAAAEAALASLPRNIGDDLQASLADELPLSKRDGGFVQSGTDDDLDEVRAQPASDRRPSGALCRRDRNSRPQNQAQQCPRLFHRGLERGR